MFLAAISYVVLGVVSVRHLPLDKYLELSTYMVLTLEKYMDQVKDMRQYHPQNRVIHYFRRRNLPLILQAFIPQKNQQSFHHMILYHLDEADHNNC